MYCNTAWRQVSALPSLQAGTDKTSWRLAGTRFLSRPHGQGHRAGDDGTVVARWDHRGRCAARGDLSWSPHLPCRS